MPSYDASVAYLLSLGLELKAGKFALEGIRRLMHELGDLQFASPVVLIAGTNGKGSTAAMIEAALRESGYRTALYTSPHLTRVNERIRVNGADISDSHFAAAWTKVSDAIERLLASGDLQKHPSFFECVTALAWVHFQAQSCDIQVLEVGMGGRLDATNLSRPLVSVITPIDLDHEPYLGNTLAKIAAEKAGIIRENGVVVSAPQQPEAAAVIAATAEARHARLVQVTAPAAGYELSLRGEHQKWNAATARAALGELREWRIPEASVRRAFASTNWPGRLERIATRPDVYLDGAHNPAGARVLRSFMERTARPRVLVFGAMRDKAIGEISEILFPETDAVVLTQPSHPRAASTGVLQEMTAHLNAFIYRRSSPAEALDLATRIAGTGGTVFVAGSLFLVGDLKAGAVVHGSK